MTKRCKNCGWLNDDNSAKCQKCNSPLDVVSTAGAGHVPQRHEERGYQLPNHYNDSENLRKTVSEEQFFSSNQVQKEFVNVGGGNCPNCDYPIRYGMSICPNCGTNLAVPKTKPVIENIGRKCWNCGEQNSANARFCGRCGVDLDRKQKVNSASVPDNSSKSVHGGTVNPWMKPKSGVFCTLRPIAWEGENITYQPLSFSGNTIVLNRANTDPNNQSITSLEQAVLEFVDGEWFILDKSSLHTTYVLATQKTKLHKGDIIVLGNRLFEFN